MADVYILLAGRTKLCVKLKNKGQICTVWRLVGVYCIQEKFLWMIFSFYMMSSWERSSIPA